MAGPLPAARPATAHQRGGFFISRTGIAHGRNQPRCKTDPQRRGAGSRGHHQTRKVSARPCRPGRKQRGRVRGAGRPSGQAGRPERIAAVRQGAVPGGAGADGQAAREHRCVGSRVSQTCGGQDRDRHGAHRADRSARCADRRHPGLHRGGQRTARSQGRVRRLAALNRRVPRQAQDAGRPAEQGARRPGGLARGKPQDGPGRDRSGPGAAQGRGRVQAHGGPGQAH